MSDIFLIKKFILLKGNDYFKLFNYNLFAVVGFAV
jgi:hypothetical protein